LRPDKGIKSGPAFALSGFVTPSSEAIMTSSSYQIPVLFFPAEGFEFLGGKKIQDYHCPPGILPNSILL